MRTVKIKRFLRDTSWRAFPYHEKDPLLRQVGAENKAKEVLTAALYSKPELLNRALAGEAVSLKLVSVGLLTASNIFGKEGTMVEDQMRAWQSLTQPGKMIHLKIRNKDGDLQTVKIKPDVAAFNMGLMSWRSSSALALRHRIDIMPKRYISY